jgi:ribosomal peptide maturation radical SAM protein 1
MGSTKLRALFQGGDALIIVPPLAALDWPALGAHLIQACAKQDHYNVSVLYANLMLAAEIGEPSYNKICNSPFGWLAGERLFAAAAFAVPSPKEQEINNDVHCLRTSRSFFQDSDFTEIQNIERVMGQWMDDLAGEILKLDFRIIGCSTLFQQTAASVALLNRIKKLRSEIVTIIGGANCEGEMAEGLLSTGTSIDYVFSGESEIAFPKLLRDLQAGSPPSERIIQGEPCRDMNLVPSPDYSDYYRQYEQFLPESYQAAAERMWLSYESSRGCWWGQKHHCTFCGLNGNGMTFRAKSPDCLIEDLKGLLKKHPSKMVLMTDNIMPYQYFRDVIPRIAAELPGLQIFYEQKSNLSLANVMALERAGVSLIQPGIESLNSSILKLMDKGVSARQNIALLRYARSLGLSLAWNLIYGLPNDRISDYEQMFSLLPLLRHLQPPSGLWPLAIDRFSPYYDFPEKYGLSNVRPWKIYSSILPPSANIAKVAYHFTAEYRSESLEHPEAISEFSSQVEDWRAAWETNNAAPPLLTITALTNDQFLLLDTRGLPESKEISFITREQARVALAGHRSPVTPEVEWALARQVAIELDSTVVPLATAEPELIQEFEAETRKGFIAEGT